jgi:hypothetical protein
MFESQAEKDKQQRRSRLLLGIGVIAALFVIGAFLLFSTMKQQAEVPTLADAVRAGNQDFEGYKSKVLLDKQEVLAQQNAMEMVMFTIQAELANHGDRTLTGVEIEAKVYDLQDKLIANRVGQPIPRQHPDPLKPGEATRVAIKLDVPQKYKEADVKEVKVELHGLRFEK